MIDRKGVFVCVYVGFFYMALGNCIQWMSSQSRGVSHLEEVLPLNALQEAMEIFLYQYHVSLVNPTRQ